jgi:hypothetical protein
MTLVYLPFPDCVNSFIGAESFAEPLHQQDS